MGAFQSQRFGAQDSVISVGATETTSLVMWPMSITASTDTLHFSYVSMFDFFSVSKTYTAEFLDDMCKYPGGNPGNIVLFGYALSCTRKQLQERFPKVQAFISFSEVLQYPGGTSNYGITERVVEKFIKERIFSSFTVDVESKSLPNLSDRKDSWAGKMSIFSTWGPYLHQRVLSFSPGTWR